MSAGPRVRTYRFQCLLQETKRDDPKDASTKSPQGPGSGHIVFNALYKKQKEMIQKMLQRNVRRALGPDISFSMLSSRSRRGDLNNASTKCPQDPGSGHIVFNVLLKETKTYYFKNASTKCPPDAGSGHIVLMFS